MGARFPIQKESVKKWIEIQQKSNAVSKVVFALRKNTTLLGTVQLHNIDIYQRKALLGTFIGSTQERNLGIGTIACSLLLDYAFNGLDLRKIGLEVISTNLKAIKLFEKLGFIQEGIKRKEYFMDGKYVDTLLFGIFKEEVKIQIPSHANRLNFSPTL
jgi:RimJ/RimL family protein N-acetyltransferase